MTTENQERRANESSFVVSVALRIVMLWLGAVLAGVLAALSPSLAPRVIWGIVALGAIVLSLWHLAALAPSKA